MSKLQERVNAQAKAYQEKHGREIHYHEYVWILLSLSGKESVPLASKTKAYKLSDTAYEVRYDNSRIVTVNAEKGITLHWGQDLGDGPIDDRMSKFFPEWNRPYGNGNYHRQKAIFVQISNKASWRNQLVVTVWKPIKTRNGSWTVQYEQLKAVGSPGRYGSQAVNPYGDIHLSWTELKELMDNLKLVK